MENYDKIFDISEETVASWLDGTLPYEEEVSFENMLESDLQLGEILDAYEDIESDFEALIEEGYELPAELGFDFQLPSVDFIDEIESNPSHYDSHFDFSNDTDAADDNHNYNEDFNADESYDSIDPSMEDFNFF